MVKRENIKTKRLARSLQLEPDLLATKYESVLTPCGECTADFLKKKNNKIPLKDVRLLTTAFFKFPSEIFNTLFA